MKKFAMLVAMALLSLGLLAGCGGGGAPDQTLTVEMGEGGQYIFNPATLSVKKGQTVEVKLVNKDMAAAHTFVIQDLGVKSKQVQPGKTESVKFKANKTGEFEFICDVAGHKEGGMVGKITVTE